MPDLTAPRAGDPGSAGRQPTATAPSRPRGRYRWWVGRSVVGALAVLTLLGLGLEWQIKHRADVGLTQHQVSALVPQSTPMLPP